MANEAPSCTSSSTGNSLPTLSKSCIHMSAMFFVAEGPRTYREISRCIEFITHREPTPTNEYFQGDRLGVISFVCLHPKVLRGRPAWDLAAGEEVEIGMHAPYLSILDGPHRTCHGSLVAYVSILEPYFKPCRPRWWRIDNAQTMQ